MIKGVIFDLGGVLIDNPALAMKSYILSISKLTNVELQTSISPLIPLFQKGLLTEIEMWKKISKETNSDIDTTHSIWMEAIKRAYSPKKEMFALVTQLKKHNLKTGILSNTEIPVVKFLSQKDYSTFDFLIYSCLEGMRKPEKEIYLLSIDRMGFTPEEIIFIDDSEENILASRDIGMHGILFTSYTQICGQIEKLTGLNLRNNEYKDESKN